MLLTQSEITVKQVFLFTIRVLKAGVLGQPRGMRWGGRGRGGSGWGTPVHQWLIHVNVWQKNYHNIVK